METIKELTRTIFYPIGHVLEMISKYFKSVLFLTLVFVIYNLDDSTVHEDNLSQANLMQIEINGVITDTKEFDKALDIAYNPNIKGVLLKVNSPGGSVAPSVEISESIKQLAKEKPIIVYGAGMIASGGYYASIWANEIIVNHGSTIGSIGVMFMGFNVEGLMKKIGVKSQFMKKGEYKEAGTFARKWNDLERKEIDKFIQNIYDRFVKQVSMARNIDIKDKNKFANGHIFGAKEAKELGLVDDLGTYRDAKKRLMFIANIKQAIWYEKKSDKVFEYIQMFNKSLIEESTNLLSSLRTTL